MYTRLFKIQNYNLYFFLWNVYIFILPLDGTSFVDCLQFKYVIGTWDYAFIVLGISLLHEIISHRGAVISITFELISVSFRIIALNTGWRLCASLTIMTTVKPMDIGVSKNNVNDIDIQ